jgi:hypothetical protein
MTTNCRLGRSRARRVLLTFGLLCMAVPSVASASTVDLETAAPFAVLGGTTVTNTGPSVLNGDLGVAPGTALLGFGTAVVNGSSHNDDAVAVQAQNDLSTAYSTAASQPVAPANVLTGQDLGGLTLTPGAYSFASTAQLTGTLTLDAQGDPNAQFVFEIGSTLTTASGSSVVLTNGGSPCNVYWQIGSSATLGSNSTFRGNLMADTSITLDTAATVQGRALASTGAVTLDDNTIDNSMCATSSTTPTPTPTPAPTPTPTPAPTPTPTPAPTPTPTPAPTPTPTPTPAPTPTPTPTPTPASPAPTATSTSTSTSTSGSTSKPTSTSGPTSTPAASSPSSQAPVRHSAPSRGGTKGATTTGTAKLKHSRWSANRPGDDGFTASVSGREIKSVRFTINGRWIGTRTRSPFRIHVPADFEGRGQLQAHVTFKGTTPARTLTLDYQASATPVVRPLPAPSTFTG